MSYIIWSGIVSAKLITSAFVSVIQIISTSYYVIKMSRNYYLKPGCRVYNNRIQLPITMGYLVPNWLMRDIINEEKKFLA